MKYMRTAKAIFIFKPADTFSSLCRDWCGGGCKCGLIILVENVIYFLTLIYFPACISVRLVIQYCRKQSQAPAFALRGICLTPVSPLSTSRIVCHTRRLASWSVCINDSPAHRLCGAHGALWDAQHAVAVLPVGSRVPSVGTARSPCR